MSCRVLGCWVSSGDICHECVGTQQGVPSAGLTSQGQQRAAEGWAVQTGGSTCMHVCSVQCLHPSGEGFSLFELLLKDFHTESCWYISVSAPEEEKALCLS